MRVNWNKMAEISRIGNFLPQKYGKQWATPFRKPQKAPKCHNYKLPQKSFLPLKNFVNQLFHSPFL